MQGTLQRVGSRVCSLAEMERGDRTMIWSPHIEDSDYVERAKVLEEQDEFARNDLVNNLQICFWNSIQIFYSTRDIVVYRG